LGRRTSKKGGGKSLSYLKGIEKKIAAVEGSSLKKKQKNREYGHKPERAMDEINEKKKKKSNDSSKESLKAKAGQISPGKNDRGDGEERHN